jgi:hypothetical protein
MDRTGRRRFGPPFYLDGPNLKRKPKSGEWGSIVCVARPRAFPPLQQKPVAQKARAA